VQLRKNSTPPSPSRPRRAAEKSGGFDFPALVDAIQRIHQPSASTASRTVNTALTLRNWAIGFYIREYEQRGRDRAKYGARLLENLSKTLKSGLDRCYTGRYLGLCRQLFDCYPQIRKSAISEFNTLALPPSTSQPIDADFRKSPISELGVSPELLVNRLSFTHFVELLSIGDPLKRAFYEIECIRGHWAVRELKRQIATLYFERSGLSKDKEKLAAIVHKSRPEGPKSYSPVRRAGFKGQNTPRAESPRSLPFASRETRIPPCRALSGRSFTGTNFPALRTGLKNFAPSVHFEFPPPIAPSAAKERGTGVPPVMADMAPHQLPFNTRSFHGRDGHAPLFFPDAPDFQTPPLKT
jgi:hypothetical protein